MVSFIEKIGSPATLANSTSKPIFPEYVSIDELAEQIRLAEDAGHTLQPTACFEIGILLQETRNLMQSIYRSADYCSISYLRRVVSSIMAQPMVSKYFIL